MQLIIGTKIVYISSCAWRTIPFSKCLGSPPFISHETAIWKGSHNPILRGLTITVLTNHLLNGMVLQVVGVF